MNFFKSNIKMLFLFLFIVCSLLLLFFVLLCCCSVCFWRRVCRLLFSGCFAFWCCPCFACRTTKQLGQCLCLPLLDVFGCVRPITMSIRVSLRQRYGIKVRPWGGAEPLVWLQLAAAKLTLVCGSLCLFQGNLCSDCLCSTFCLPCVWCQMATEMKKQKLPTVQWHHPPVMMSSASWPSSAPGEINNHQCLLYLSVICF